jgi:tetratricopeptide (TPR) repeat protein
MSLNIKFIRKVAILLCWCFTWGGVIAQQDTSDLFSKSNSIRYAQYLFESSQYRLAISEFERLIFVHPDLSELHIQLVSSYRLHGDFQTAEQRLNQFTNRLFTVLPSAGFSLEALTTDGYAIPSEVAYFKEYLRLQIQQKRYQSAIGFLQVSGEYLNDAPYANNLLVGSFLASGDFSASRLTLTAATHPAFRDLLNDYEGIRLKKPWVAGAASALLPGLGKAYTGRWRDGAVSLLFVSVNGFVAYQSFARNGISSPYGWIFGTLSTSFYIGNIVGSSKAAKKYNNDRIKVIQESAHETLLRLY